MASCIGFQMEDIHDALRHMKTVTVREYGDMAYGHLLHTWDDGERLLVKCVNCGGYFMIQHSEFHSFSGDDSYYTDYFPVESEEEADELNRKYDGFEIEEKFPGRYIIADLGRYGWAEGC